MTIVRLTIRDLRFAINYRLAICDVATVQNSQSLKANVLFITYCLLLIAIQRIA